MAITPANDPYSERDRPGGMTYQKTFSADAGGPYQFPQNLGRGLLSRITFQAIEVTPPTIDFNFKSTNTSNDIVGKVASGLKDTYNSTVSGIQSASATKIRPVPGNKVSLYLPIALQVSDNFQYEGTQLGAIGGAAAEALNSGAGVTGGMMGAAEEAWSAFTDFFKLFMGSESVSRLAVARTAGRLPLGIGSAVQITSRITLNPNIRTKFNGTNIREFNFNFKLIPKSPNEAVQIKKIVRFFRLHAYPDGEPPNSDFAIGLNYPNMFKIRLQSGSGGTFKSVGTPLKYCYLRNVSVVYNPTTPVLHADGSPTEVDINLAFMEYKTLRRRDIKLEGSEAFYSENATDAFVDAMQSGFEESQRDGGLPAGDPAIYDETDFGQIPGVPKGF